MKSKLPADNLPIHELALYWAPEIGWPVALLERQLHHFALDGTRNSFGVILRGFRGPAPAPAPVYLNHEQRVDWAKMAERAGVFREPMISALVDEHAKTMTRLLGRAVTREELIDSYIARPLWGLSKEAAQGSCARVLPRAEAASAVVLADAARRRARSAPPLDRGRNSRVRLDETQGH
jgi:hypothetical protein